MKTKAVCTAALLVGLSIIQLPRAFGQGDLVPPPGPPAPTMKRLDQIEARTIVNAASTPGDAANTFIISAPGSYYFAGNITGEAGKHGISIQANDVTLDLNGFALISGGGGAFRGVNAPAAQTNFSIRNGTVRGWTDGGVRTDLATSTLAEKLRIADNVGAWGLAFGNGSARDCVASGNGTGFVLGNGAQIKDCAATGNTTGFLLSERSHASNCIATINAGIGFNCASHVMLIDCTASRNGGHGIVVQGGSSVIRCNSSRNVFLNGSNGGSGIVAGTGCTIADCTAGSNTAGGISADSGSTIQNCTASDNGASGISVTGSTVVNCTARGHNNFGHAGFTALGPCNVVGNTADQNFNGFYVTNGSGSSGSRIEANNATRNSSAGFSTFGTGHLMIRNSARGNGSNFLLGGAYGRILDVSAGGQITVSEPWANFSY